MPFKFVRIYYAKKGTPCCAYFFKPSSLISTPIPGLSDTVKNPLSIKGLSLPSYLTISFHRGTVSNWLCHSRIWKLGTAAQTCADAMQPRNEPTMCGEKGV